MKCENHPKRNAKFECEACGSKFCKQCEENYFGECPNCEPPILIEIKPKIKNKKGGRRLK